MTAAVPLPNDGPGSSLPRYSVRELNEAIGGLLERGFAPRFLLDATVGRPQLKKGHLWLTLTDGDATISGVVWASQRARLSLQPEDGDGVVVVGRLNFWAARASLCVQILDLRPSLSAVLRRFEQVRAQLEPEGLLAPERRRPLLSHPRRLALLTSVPSSALADMLRTARERWPATAILVVPIPVQGAVQGTICRAIEAVGQRAADLGLDALVLARGGGSREDLAVFDDAQLARTLAACPIPVICGLGHEDDTTIADLVADYRAATPTAAIVAALPDRQTAIQQLDQRRLQLHQLLRQRLQRQHQHLAQQRHRLAQLHPSHLLPIWRERLNRQRRLLLALSPTHVMERGFAVVRGIDGTVLRSIQELEGGAVVQVQLRDGWFQARVEPEGCHTLEVDDTQVMGDGEAPQER